MILGGALEFLRVTITKHEAPGIEQGIWERTRGVAGQDGKEVDFVVLFSF